MADGTKIEWTDATWNPIVGCSVVSPGCTNCYAMRMAARLEAMGQKPYKGKTRKVNGNAVWTGEIGFVESRLAEPLLRRRPTKYFVNSMSDLFHENVPDEWIDRVFAVMALAPQHTFQVLTKRARRMRAYFAERWQGTPAQTVAGLHIPAGGETGRRGQIEEACQPLLDRFKLADPARDELWTPGGKCKAMQWAWPLPNVWLGVSAEDQPRADERIPDLLATPAAVRWVSAEPLLGPVDLTTAPVSGRSGWLCPLTGEHKLQPIHADHRGARIDWLVAGGESGPGARPCHPNWARKLRDDCQAAGVAFFMKQMAKKAPIPNDLMIREYPNANA